MTVQEVSKISGQYQISKGVSKTELETLAKNPKTSSIQFVSPLADKEIENLEQFVFSKRPDILLRVYGHYSEVCDLHFLNKIPSLKNFSADCLMEAKGIEAIVNIKDIETLGVGIYNLNSFDFLDNISPTLKKLSLQQTKSKKPKIDSISRFTNLENLYLEGQSNGIAEINKLKKLQQITLRSISNENLDYLIGLNELWSLDIKLGGIKNFSALERLSNIKYLELWQIRDLSDLSFISNMIGLQNLFIQSLKNVTKLPALEKLINLRRIYLENLKGLKDISSLRNAPSLEEFYYVLAENQEPENLLPILENPNNKSVFCKFGSDKKNNLFDNLMIKHRKTMNKYSEFKYE